MKISEKNGITTIKMKSSSYIIGSSTIVILSIALIITSILQWKNMMPKNQKSQYGFETTWQTPMQHAQQIKRAFIFENMSDEVETSITEIEKLEAEFALNLLGYEDIK
jgi:transposase